MYWCRIVDTADVFSSAVEADIKDREHVALKLQTEYASQFGYNPLVLMSVLVTPLILITFNVSPYFYLPIALLLLSYLKAKQERHDRKSAMGIVDDANVSRVVSVLMVLSCFSFYLWKERASIDICNVYQILKYVIEEMPGWVKNADVERANWLNHTLQTLWPKISLATGDLMVLWFQPLLNSYKPPGGYRGDSAIHTRFNTCVYLSSIGFTSLDIARFSLGTVAPKIAGVRYQFTEESCARLDIELKWAGNPEVCVGVGGYDRL